jgi:hypothetical protein
MENGTDVSRRAGRLLCAAVGTRQRTNHGILPLPKKENALSKKDAQWMPGIASTDFV